MDRKQLEVDFFARSTVENPFPMYEQVRALGACVWNPLLPGWMVTGFDECNMILTDTGSRFAMVNTTEMNPWFLGTNMMMVDGVEHRRLRGALAPLFTKREAAKWERRVREVVAELLEPLTAGSGTYDLIADFTRIPTIIVADMLGVPAERHDDFQRWSSAVAAGLAYGHEDPVTAAALAKVSRDLNGYLAEEIERHRKERPDDLLTAMVDMEAAGTMSEEEILSTAVLLLLAGYDTTAKMLSNALIALEAHPDQRQLVVEDPGLVPQALEEVLRWLSVTHALPRRVEADVVVDGQELAAGEFVYALLAAANRDPRRWENPEKFDILRQPMAHFGFGFGTHLCLGAPLARLESRIAIEELLRRSPQYHLSNIELGPSFFIRGPDRGSIEVATPA